MPLMSMEPHAAGHDEPEMLQAIEALGWPLLTMAAWNGCVAPSSTAVVLGVRTIEMSLTTVIVAEACLVGSATLCAVTVTVEMGGRICGAV